MTLGFGPNPNTNLLRDSVSDLTPKPATDSYSRPNPKDSVKSNFIHGDNVIKGKPGLEKFSFSVENVFVNPILFVTFVEVILFDFNRGWLSVKLQILIKEN